MKKVRFTQPRVTTHGSIAVGDTGILTDNEAEKLVQRGQAVILEDVSDPKPAPVETAKAPDHAAAEHADARPVKARYGGKPAE